MKEMKDKIQRLHDSDMYGVFVEMGCGTAVTSALYSVAGASKTVYFAESPYSKDRQEELFGKASRAVSIERVNGVLETYWEKYSDKVNCVYAATFQIDDGDGSKSTHGWIGVRNKQGKKFYHITVPEIFSRDMIFGRIAEQGISVLSGQIPDNVDIINDGDQDADINDVINNFSDLNTVCFSNGKLVRPEDVIRNKKHVVLYKGSFNPMHVGHMSLIKRAQDRFGEDVILGLSAHPFGKNDMDSISIAQRAKHLNALGFDVAVFRSGYFNENDVVLRRITKAPISYVVGSDTMDRILKSSFDVLGPTLERNRRRNLRDMYETFGKDSSFFVIHRAGDAAEYQNIDFTEFPVVETCSKGQVELISSTEIRNAIEKNDWEFVSKNAILPIVTAQQKSK